MGSADAAAAVPFRIPPPFADTPPHCTPEFCINERGYKIVQLWQEMPALAPLYTEFESGRWCLPNSPWLLDLFADPVGFSLALVWTVLQ